MKIMRLLLALVVTLTLGFTMMPGDSFSKEIKEVASVTGSKAKLEIPTNININTADQELLTKLPGIGPKTADSIIAYRDKNGTFSSINDLTAVKGIGDKTLKKLKPYLKKI